MLCLSSFPRAILHVDGDCFFASCEVARRPELRGRPVVTGLERGIVSSLTYEAKARGVRRPMPLWQVRKICPEAVCLPSDYEAYSLYSLRMFNIVRRFTPTVEEYSIDECFADLTGMRRTLGMSYEEMAQKIKAALDRELGFTFSVGLAPSKVLAKVGSKWQKPSGLTIIPGRDIESYLARTEAGKLWGIGPQTSEYLAKCGIRTALEFATRDERWVRQRLCKPQLEIWQELRGQSVWAVDPDKKSGYQSISKTKTFTPPSRDRGAVFSQLSRNVENACIKLRRHGLRSGKIFFFLKTQEFRYAGLELKLERATDNPMPIVGMIDRYFDQVFTPSGLYRATGVVCLDMEENGARQADLFSEVVRAERVSRIFASADALSRRYGKHAVCLGSSLEALTKSLHAGERGQGPARDLFKGETKRKHLGIPYLGEAK